MIHVYHAMTRETRFSPNPDAWKAFYLDGQNVLPNTTYQKVAEVEDDEDLEIAYRLTQTIDRPWHEQAGVEPIGDGPFRSTSVGDVLVTEDGKAFMIHRVGFIAVGAGPFHA